MTFGFLKEGSKMNDQELFCLRADQYKNDPSKWFVMPKVDTRSLNSGDHPIRLIGSRGSGKTMLLRSIAGKPFGETIPDNSLNATKRLRIYIRPDNNLMGSMQGWGLDDVFWITVSTELMLFRIFEEAVKKINYWLAERGFPPLYFNENTFSFDENGEELSSWIKIKTHLLCKWARVPIGFPPIEIATMKSLATLITSLESYIEEFPKDFRVSVYFDEQESYLEYQQIIINDWIKNPPEGWVFHVAHRRYLDYVVKTSTDEIIDKSNDFMEIDMDLPLVDSHPDSKRIRESFYERVIINEIKQIGLPVDQFDSEDFKPKDLLPSGKMNHATTLRNDNYTKQAWRRRVQIASEAINHKKKQEIQELIQKGNSVSDDRIWVLWPVLVARRKFDQIDQIDLNNFIHNYLNGAILQLYFEAKGRAPMDYYSGFSTLCSIVLSNVREFFLILQNAIEYEYQYHERKDIVDVLKNNIAISSQYKAVIERSKRFNDVVAISAAERGVNIDSALFNWFTFFSNCQRFPTLPYNEPNHINCSDSIDKSNSAWKTIKAGEKHGAFIFTPSSKQKGHTKDAQRDIRIHPLLGIKYFLSYSKRNTPSLTFEQISLITEATDIEEVKKIAQSIRPSTEKATPKPDVPWQGSLFE